MKFSGYIHKEQVIRFWEWSGSLCRSMKNKLGVIRITIGKNMKYRGKKAISVLMVGSESPGIELLWRRSVLSDCSCCKCHHANRKFYPITMKLQRLVKSSAQIISTTTCMMLTFSVRKTSLCLVGFQQKIGSITADSLAKNMEWPSGISWFFIHSFCFNEETVMTYVWGFIFLIQKKSHYMSCTECWNEYLKHNQM